MLPVLFSNPEVAHIQPRTAEVYYSAAPTSDAWRTYDIRREAEDLHVFYIDNTFIVSQSDKTIPEMTGIYFASHNTTQYLYVDWIVMRKFVDPEPVHSYWGEEEILLN